ncbi:MAG TPA: SRPBCC family protein [Leptospiraceae bacterium]|nr:SRPBCC family protein [Leptospiraceae bacterium]HMY68414.1 SRPBCC family protein [Leptospiraceae bacterium]HMZ58413.1 SRPBCC family protein [Leptospiraceae bacterium]HNF16288.1 SRPBCC family protein [Leptospiraceae bacterium]HNF25744.1 SRPBCC family protein [Leptospiraceae bacterium]
MSLQTLKREQTLPVSMEKAWDFFSDPENLNEITPEDMTFRIMSTLPEKMYEGMLIHYKISPFLSIPLDWVTEITHIREKEFFIDEQRIGPYRIWHHEHHFRKAENGILMTDLLNYDVGMGVLGSIAGAVFVHRKVRSIFDYRYEKLKNLFPG